jgi:hypothetical protein
VNNAKRSRIDEDLVEIFNKQIELEIHLEKVKCKLALKIDFNLKDLFYFMDVAN